MRVHHKTAYIIWYDMIWYDMIWYGVMWRDVTGHEVTGQGIIHNISATICNNVIPYNIINYYKDT